MMVQFILKYATDCNGSHLTPCFEIYLLTNVHFKWATSVFAHHTETGQQASLARSLQTFKINLYCISETYIHNNTSASTFRIPCVWIHCSISGDQVSIDVEDSFQRGD